MFWFGSSIGLWLQHTSSCPPLHSGHVTPHSHFLKLQSGSTRPDRPSLQSNGSRGSEQQQTRRLKSEAGPNVRTEQRRRSRGAPARRRPRTALTAARAAAHLLRQVRGQRQPEQHRPRARRRPGRSAGGDGE